MKDFLIWFFSAMSMAFAAAYIGENDFTGWHNFGIGFVGGVISKAIYDMRNYI